MTTETTQTLINDKFAAMHAAAIDRECMAVDVSAPIKGVQATKAKKLKEGSQGSQRY